MLRSQRPRLYVLQTPGAEDWEPVTQSLEGVKVPILSYDAAEASEMRQECQRMFPGVRFRVVTYIVSGYSEEKANYGNFDPTSGESPTGQ